jgi:hypothetical protein
MAFPPKNFKKSGKIRKGIDGRSPAWRCDAHGDDLVARPSGSIGVTWGFASVPDRAKANSAFLRCRTRVVPLRTVNESLNGDAMHWH